VAAGIVLPRQPVAFGIITNGNSFQAGVIVIKIAEVGSKDFGFAGGDSKLEMGPAVDTGPFFLFSLVW